MAEQEHESCFQCDDVSFAVGTEVHDGVFRWVVHFENCRTIRCVLTVSLVGFDSSAQHSVQIDCAADSSGTSHSAWPVPNESQCRLERFLVYADVSRPEGSGDLRRPPAGRAVSSQRSPGGEFLRNIATALIAHHFVLEQTPMIEVEFPRGVASFLPGDSSAGDDLLPPMFQYLILAVLVACLLLGLIAYLRSR